MQKNEKAQSSSISRSRTIEDIAEFWDTHSLDDFWDQTHPAEFQIRAARRHRIVLAPEVFNEISELARIQGVSPETLVNLWLAEQVQKTKLAKAVGSDVLRK